MAFIIREFSKPEELMNYLIGGNDVRTSPIKTTIIPQDPSEICDISIHNSPKDKFEIAQEGYKHIYEKMKTYCDENKTSIHPEICKIINENILSENDNGLSIFNFTILYEQLADWIKKNPDIRKTYTAHLMWFHDKIQAAKVFYAKAIST
jgi:hypothetical protein